MGKCVPLRSCRRAHDDRNLWALNMSVGSGSQQLFALVS